MRYVEDARALPDRLTRGQKLLGLDLGSKTIGLAVSDTGLKIATPRETIKRRKFGVDAERLEQVIAADDIGGLVVGLPVNMNGTHGARAPNPRKPLSAIWGSGTASPICRCCFRTNAFPPPPSSGRSSRPI